ncbi:DUF3226 domain-containing protein [Larkinella punicea]|uniref:DUF4276 family protein n=1 Tax=Larkinella punicea TaxID=2315727 RepID=A0A368JTU1_9BACT|nr:DUF3226 domain-containing protein [Larkinella punicea]RCR70872.1 hypothetical protein DUE52_04595 [Larkinella punicea]
MIAVQFFVEGISDRKFLKDLMKHWYAVELGNDDIEVLEGKDALRSVEKLKRLRPSFETNLKQGVRSIVILDADSDFGNRRDETAELAAEFIFDFYLWPNHTDSGDLESVLEKIYNPSNHDFFDCWRGYESCLLASGKYTTPNRKAKIFAYLESLHGSSKSQKELLKEEKRDFLNEKLWNLDASQPVLLNLKVFLDRFFIG